MRTKYKEYANLIKAIALKHGEERASKCGYDLMIGLDQSNDTKREEAWQRFLEEEKNSSHTDEFRDGCWVPAISYS